MNQKIKRRMGILIMTNSNPIYYWHIHHDTLIESASEPIENRIEYIKSHKPQSEIETRLRLLKPVKNQKLASKARSEYYSIESKAWSEYYSIKSKAWSEYDSIKSKDWSKYDTIKTNESKK